MTRLHRYLTTTALIVVARRFPDGLRRLVVSGRRPFRSRRVPRWARCQLGWVSRPCRWTAAVGMLASGPLSDRLGRRPVLQSPPCCSPSRRSPRPWLRLLHAGRCPDARRLRRGGRADRCPDVHAEMARRPHAGGSSPSPAEHRDRHLGRVLQQLPDPHARESGARGPRRCGSASGTGAGCSHRDAAAVAYSVRAGRWSPRARAGWPCAAATRRREVPRAGAGDGAAAVLRDVEGEHRAGGCLGQAFLARVAAPVAATW